MSHWKTEYLSKIKGLRSLIVLLFSFTVQKERICRYIKVGSSSHE